MKNLEIKTSIILVKGKGKSVLMIVAIVCCINLITPISASRAQSVLFDFDNIPQYSTFPVTVTVNGITAHLAGTGLSYSVQAANVLGFTPAGFSGNCIYPNSIYLADLLISFDQTIDHFSIMYSPQELGCDTSALMRATAYMNGTYVGTNTMTAVNPGTWPTDTLGCSFAQGFDSVVVHYDHIPWPCQDYGVIFMADNMWVNQFASGIATHESFMEDLLITNPVLNSAIISFSLFHPEKINISVYELSGRIINNLFDGSLNKGKHQLNWNVKDDAMDGGVYLVTITSKHFSKTCKLIVMK